MKTPTVELIITADGSSSLFVPSLNEQYHSVHGALTESLHVYIKQGLCAFNEKPTILSILEIGFGTGLNALLTYWYRQNNKAPLRYVTLEPFPLTMDVVNQLHFPMDAAFINNKEVLWQLHNQKEGELLEIQPAFQFLKYAKTLQDFEASLNSFDLIYFDAFAPEKQPEMWTQDVFERIHAWMVPQGRLVTYCAKGIVKRTLRAAGFTVQAVPGPPGKREMIVAVK